MPSVPLNGIELSYDDQGSGEPVVLVMGSGASRRSWHLHQVPALTAAGYRVVSLDNRGLPPNESPPGGITLDAMAQDVLALVDHLALAPCRLVGFSLGASIVAEALLARPTAARQAVLMAGRARPDAFSTAVSLAERELADSRTELPPGHLAVHSALRYLSPATLRDEQAIRDWLDVFHFAPPLTGPGIRAQLALDDSGDRRAAYRAITTPALCLGFADDVAIPAAATRELADCLPRARYTELPDCGHYGYLERPAEVNAALLDFFAGCEA
ncbi:putative hydrolase [Streptomyces albus]|uniref:Putative hydrolase n=1 Tax=Streptomyces albus (strain ATCC 21838 / DSM 41398 / FERM P-419 / JCM 4703 / NBRC 107858) TaxID=1081613 RepID=A0A0B5EGS1_STRA4|nr:putative hydrolase [Streptomyces albus]AOU74881.1 putative hydrolase [Streptomyces albus]AYN30690.1 alpha/beta hydrolase [Streptomyces albus]